MNRLGHTLVALAVLACACNSGGGAGGPMGGDSDGGTDGPTGFVTAMHLPFPQVATNDNVNLSPAKIVTLVAQNDTFADKLVQFGDELAQGGWWGQVTGEYGLAKPVGSAHVVGPAIPMGNFRDVDMRAYIQAQIAAGTIPAPDGNTMYMLYLPDGVTAVDTSGNVNTDCNTFEGYHQSYRTGPDNWAFAQRCFGDTQQGLDDVTNTGSHEILEGATDPTGGGWSLGYPSRDTPWTTDVWDTLGFGANAEVADLCNGTAYYDGAGHFQYQRGWSNKAAATGGDPCVPAIAHPYYNVSPTQGWFTIQAGQSLDIPIVGWSTAPTSDWTLDAAESISDRSGDFRPKITAPRTAFVSGSKYPVVNNGETATLTVTAPSDGQSGDYAAFVIYSSSTKDKGGDMYHMWPVGVYIP